MGGRPTVTPTQVQGLRPGCYLKQAHDNGKCGGQKLSWTRDVWGEENRGSGRNKAKCLGRKAAHDKFCGSNSQWKFVPGAPETAAPETAAPETAAPETAAPTKAPQRPTKAPQRPTKAPQRPTKAPKGRRGSGKKTCW